MESQPFTSNAERTLRLIEVLLSEPDGLTPQEMLDLLGTSRSSLFNLLGRLKSLGYIDQAEKRGRYRAGPRLSAWRSAPTDRMQTLLSAFYQEAGRQNWPETLLLCIPAPDGATILGQVETSQVVRSVYFLGNIMPSPGSIPQALKANPPDEIKKNGYAFRQTQQLVELALPICADGSHPIALVVLTAPAYRWDLDTLLGVCLPDLRILAARLSYRMGAAVYSPFQGNQQLEITSEQELTRTDIDEFLDGPWTARLACIRPDGNPHVIPVWQSWDGVNFTVFALKGSQWAEYVLLDPRVSLTIDEPWPPFRRVVARGVAGALPMHGSEADIDKKLSDLNHRYLGAAATTYKVDNVQQVFRIDVETLRGWQGLPGSGV